MRGAWPNGVHPWFHVKPLDAAIGQVPTLYCPGNRHGWQFWMKQKNTNKTQLLPSLLMVDWRKKANQFQDPSRTLYSCPWRNYPDPNPNATIHVEEISYILSYQM